MLSKIQITETRLPLETIEALSQFGIDITVSETGKYGYWAYDASMSPDIDADTVLSNEEKAQAVYQDACRKNQHMYSLDGVVIVDLIDFIQVFPNLKFTVEKTFISKSRTPDNAADALFHVVDRLKEKLTEISSFDDSRSLFNDKCQVHIGGSHLLLINQLRLEEDCCTDHLQEQLDKGWRIVSVNHQEARRPDYVLGKYNPAKD